MVDAALRRTLGEEAVALAKAAGYHGAGTVEFIADADDPATHFFLEMNARLQVEHPITEMVTGVDLVEWQLRIARGERLDIDSYTLVPRGHAIECLIYAEDPDMGFLPSQGRVPLVRAAAGP